MRDKGEQWLSILWFLSLAGSACILYMKAFLHKEIALPWLIAVPTVAAVLTVVNLILTHRREKQAGTRQERKQPLDGKK